ncbi:MAG TPA: YihY/virulence factor BrkB family protein [Propionibacteriaceae bacterium]|nr:YihY/virulence factor BrkB family protein [Propionibacteriaceae bacterium]
MPGEDADRPQEIPAKGWVQVFKRGWKEAKIDQVPLLAAGVAFFSFLSLFPALIALVMLYGLFADPAQVSEQLSSMTQNMPSDARSLLETQVQSLTATPQQSLGIGLVISLLIAFWSASGGVGQLITAVNTTYDEEETRGFVKRKALALGLTVAAILFMVVMITLVAVAPPLLDNLLPAGPVRWLVEVLRWVLLVVVVAVALAVLYRVAPARDAPKMRWVSVGAVVATVLWVIASIGFTIYVSNFGSYAKTYGALAGVVVLLLWLWITCYAVLLGAEINAESEEQTVSDTTKGPAEPLGQRGAVKADSTPHK